MNYGTAETHIRNRLGEDSPTANQEVWTEAMVHDSFHEGELAVVRDLPDDALWYHTKTEQDATITGTTTVLPNTSEMVRLSRVDIDGVTARLINPKEGILAADSNSLWRGTTAQYTAWMAEGKLYFTPSISSKTIDWWYIFVPVDGSGTDANNSSLNEEHAIIAILYATAICWEREEESQLAAISYQKYREAIADVWARFDARHGLFNA